MKRLPSLVALLGLVLCAGLPAQAQEGMDLAKMVQAPGQLPLGEGAAVGMRFERLSVMPALKQETREYLAIVGEQDGKWQIETNVGLQGFAALPGGKDISLALLVDKESFVVERAHLFHKGKLKPIKVMKAVPFPKPEEGEKATETVKLPSGKEVKAEVQVTEVGNKEYRARVGAKGTPLEGIMLSFSGGQQEKSLKEDPVLEQVALENEVEGKPLKVEAYKVTYTDGQTMWITRDPLARALGQAALRFEMPSMTMRIVKLERDAKPTLPWK